jgi:protein-tyrosine kinase
MSLVERALKKLQESAAPVPAPTPQPRAPMAEPAPAAAFPQRPLIEKSSRVVHIDREALRAAQLLPPPAMERHIAGQYRQIKRPLIAAAFGKSETPIEYGNVIMCASALSGEGKTFTSINLALSIAREKDVEVVLVNGDVAKPHLDRLFGLEGERGLMELLADHTLHPESFVLKTDVPGLSILPAGNKTDMATELLASERMQEVMHALSRHTARRIILLDSPPLLLSTESQALVASVGQIVLIVRADMTPQSAVMEAIEVTGGTKPISLILNQCCHALAAGYYGYGSYGNDPDTQAT